jgi:hypothetical protein
MPRSLYPQEKSPWYYPLDRRLGGHQSQSGHGVEEEISNPPPGFEPRSSERLAQSQSLYRLSYPTSYNLLIPDVFNIFNAMDEINLL